MNANASGTTPGKRQERGVAEGKLVETANSLSPSLFFQRYLPVELLQTICSEARDGQRTLHPIYGDALSLKGTLLDRCFDLIEESSAEDYRHSEIKWSPAKKKQEMALSDLRYIVLQYQDEQKSQQLVGFVSFMVTYEDGHEVIYCYEIHLAQSWRGRGLGKKLMRVIEAVGRDVGVEKSMLTVFKSNKHALGMYGSLGYAEDEYSPGPRKLRNGTLKEPTYTILSKPLK